MDDLVKSRKSDIIGMLHDKSGNLSIPAPFERDIFLFDTIVAGTSHINEIEKLTRCLKTGDKLEFFREPDNPHDSQAIVIRNLSGTKIGYIPKSDNIVFSRLMDAGKLLFGVITSNETKGNWLKIKINIFLHE